MGRGGGGVAHTRSRDVGAGQGEVHEALVASLWQ